MTIDINPTIVIAIVDQGLPTSRGAADAINAVASPVIAVKRSIERPYDDHRC